MAILFLLVVIVINHYDGFVFLLFAGYKIVLIKEDSVKITKEIKKEIIKKKKEK